MPFIKGNKPHNAIDLIGRRFGKLVVISRAENSKDDRSMWLCKCDCGKEKIIKGKYLLNGNTKSCGCLSTELLIRRNIESGCRGGESYEKIYYTWYNMISRCKKGHGEDGENYKSRGISICKEWESYENFRDWSLENGFSENLTIDRVDNDGDYEPSNCRWTTVQVQANNRRSNHNVEFNGVTKTLADWSRFLNLDYGMLRARIKYGWGTDRLFSPPMHTEYKRRI